MITPDGVLLTIVTRSDVIFFSVDIDARVESLVMFFSFTKNNGTGRDTLSLDIVNFREVILMTELLSREVRLGDSPYLRFPCLYCRMFVFLAHLCCNYQCAPFIVLTVSKSQK